MSVNPKDTKNIFVSVQSKDFITGTPNTVGSNPQFSNLTVSSQTPTGRIEWKVNLPHDGKYYLHARLTSMHRRPCTLSINGVNQTGTILGENTGSWQSITLRWFVYGPYEFKEGDNHFAIAFTNGHPHLEQFGFSAEPLNGRDALQKLQEGYARYAAGKPQVTPARLLGQIQAYAKKQHPFAIVVACSDSRVPPEIIFDQDVGDLFVARVAGNVAGSDVLGSIQYAVQHLGVKLILVLGHERCGAITAALSVAAGKGGFPGPLGQLVSSIVPLVDPVYRAGLRANLKDTDTVVVDQAVDANIRRQIAIIRDALENLGDEKLTLELWLRQILVVGAHYDLDEGKVVFFNVPPEDGAKRIGLLAHGGLGVTVTAADGALNATPGPGFDDFEIHDAGQGRFALKSVINGRFLRVDGTTATAASAAATTDAERFSLLEFGDKRYALQNVGGLYLSLQTGGRIGLASTTAPGDNQLFRIVEVDEE
jgi:carbonic anhydrase